MVKPTCLAMPVAAKVVAVIVMDLARLGVLELALLLQVVKEVKVAKAARPKFQLLTIGVLTR